MKLSASCIRARFEGLEDVGQGMEKVEKSCRRCLEQSYFCPFFLLLMSTEARKLMAWLQDVFRHQDGLIAHDVLGGDSELRPPRSQQELQPRLGNDLRVLQQLPHQARVRGQACVWSELIGLQRVS
eukprot:749080-Hanusia_phi.AAC.3